MFRLLFIIGIIICSASIVAADRDITLISRAEKSTVLLRDTIKFEIVLKVKKGIDASLPEIGNDIKNLSILDFGKEGPNERDGSLYTRVWYDLKAEKIGDYILPAVKVTYRDGDGRDKSVNSAEVYVRVVEDDQIKLSDDIKDIRPLIQHAYWGKYLVILIVAIVILGIYFLIKRRKAESKVETKVIMPWEEALELLNELETVKVETVLDSKRFHFKLSLVLRAFVEKIYMFNATDMTTEEIKNRLKTFPESQTIKEAIIELLKVSDVAKFTDLLVKEDESRTALSKAIALVIEIRDLRLVNGRPDVQV